MGRRIGAPPWLSVALLAGLAGGPAQAQVRRITFSEAVEIALRQNSALARAENASELARFGVSQAQASFFPDLRLGLSDSYSFDSSLHGGGGSARAGLSSGVTLFDGLANVANLRAAQLEEEGSGLDEERTRQTVVFDVISGYLAMIEAGEQARVREENLAAQEKQEESVRALVEGGERPIAELYQQQSNVAAARLARVEARQALELSRVDLVQALQLDPAGEYDFAPPPLSEARPDSIPLALAPVLARAFERRPDLQAEEVRLEVARQEERGAVAGRWPTVSLSADYGGALDQVPSGSVGISLSLPLFDRLNTSESIARARIGTRNEELALLDLRQDIALQVRRAVLDRNAGLERLQAAEAQVLAAGKALEFTQQRYDAGVATLYEVTLARADHVAAVSASVRARYNLLWQDRLLDYYVGDLDPSAGLMP